MDATATCKKLSKANRSPQQQMGRDKRNLWYQQDKTPKLSPTLLLPAALRGTNLPVPRWDPLPRWAVCSLQAGAGARGKKEQGLELLRGGCRASLTHAEGDGSGSLLKSRGAGAGGAACCLPRWSGLCCAKAAPRGPYIQGKGVGGQSKLPREEHHS